MSSRRPKPKIHCVNSHHVIPKCVVAASQRTGAAGQTTNAETAPRGASDRGDGYTPAPVGIHPAPLGSRSAMAALASSCNPFARSRAIPSPDYCAAASGPSPPATRAPAPAAAVVTAASSAPVPGAAAAVARAAAASTKATATGSHEAPASAVSPAERSVSQPAGTCQPLAAAPARRTVPATNAAWQHLAKSPAQSVNPPWQCLPASGNHCAPQPGPCVPPPTHPTPSLHRSVAIGLQHRTAHAGAASATVPPCVLTAAGATPAGDEAGASPPTTTPAAPTRTLAAARGAPATAAARPLRRPTASRRIAAGSKTSASLPVTAGAEQGSAGRRGKGTRPCAPRRPHPAIEHRQDVLADESSAAQPAAQRRSGRRQLRRIDLAELSCDSEGDSSDSEGGEPPRLSGGSSCDTDELCDSEENGEPQLKRLRAAQSALKGAPAAKKPTRRPSRASPRCTASPSSSRPLLPPAHLTALLAEVGPGAGVVLTVGCWSCLLRPVQWRVQASEGGCAPDGLPPNHPTASEAQASSCTRLHGQRCTLRKCERLRQQWQGTQRPAR